LDPVEKCSLSSISGLLAINTQVRPKGKELQFSCGGEALGANASLTPVTGEYSSHPLPTAATPCPFADPHCSTLPPGRSPARTLASFASCQRPTGRRVTDRHP